MKVFSTTVMLVLFVPVLVLALPYGAQITSAGSADEMVVQVNVYVLGDAVDPPDHWRLVRATTAPGLAAPLNMTSEWQEMPDIGGSIDSTWPDPSLPDLAIGYYEVWGLWTDDAVEVRLDVEALSRVEHPYILRGSLLSPTELEVCNDGDLLECTAVTLADPSWWTDIGPGVLLDIYGWPTDLTAVDDCAATITWVEPMPPGSDCNSPMPTEQCSWSTIRALFR